jgi:hypothetical protein
MGGKRVEPTGHYIVRFHPSIKGLVNIYWQANESAHPDPRPLLTLGASAVPVLAEALAEWELEHHAPPPRHGGLRAVNDDGAV